MSPAPVADFVLTGASELVTCAGPAPAAGEAQSRTGVIRGGAVAARDGVILWAGPEEALVESVEIAADARRLDAGGRAVLPGLVDTHTHLVWAGERADEFEKRLAGASYGEILAAGGGILRTVDATRAESLETLAEHASARMDALSRFGVTAVEVKSGYGLELEAELKILRAARQAAAARPFEVVTTFLGAHTLPREARPSAAARERYIATVIEEMIPAVAEEGLARFADVFVDEHAFSLVEARAILGAAKRAGLGLKVHADQLGADGGAELAAEMGAASADHLEHLTRAGLRALAAAGTVGVLLPGASLFLRMHDFADGRAMIDANVPVAVATDLNPGSCPCESLPLIMQLACLYCGLSVDEAIIAATLNAAAASGLEQRCGSIEVGKRCDLLVLDAPRRRDLIYRLGAPRIRQLIVCGEILR